MMWTHKGAKLGAMMIGRHKEITLIFVCWITCGGLCGNGQSLEIEFISVTLAMHLRHDVLVIVISRKRRKSQNLETVWICIIYLLII